MKSRILITICGLIFLLPAKSLLADPLDQWTLRFPYPTAATLSAVTYGGGQFVAVGGGTIISSTDGYNWINRTSGVSSSLRAIAFADGQFAVVGDGGIIIVSTNAATWVQVASTNSNTLRGIAGNPAWAVNGLPRFLAVGDQGTAVWCINGTNWNVVSSSTSNNLSGVTLSGSIYIMVGEKGTVIRYTSGGGFVQRPQNFVGTTNNIICVASIGNGVVAAAGALFPDPYTYNVLNQILYSGNTGTRWTNQIWINGADQYGNQLWNLSEYFVLTGMAYGSNGFVAVGYTANSLEYHPAVVMTSTNGKDWIEMPPTTSQNALSGVTYGNGLYVAVGDYGEIVVSTNAVDWAEINAPHRNAIIAMAANTNNLCIALSLNAWYNWGFPNFRALVSTNGSNWKSARTRFELPVITDLACDGNLFVGVSGTTVYTTTDGYNWQTISGFTNALNGVRCLNGQFFAVGDNGAIYKSADGTNWSNQTLDLNGSFDGIAYGNGIYLAAGTIAATSTDGINWTLCPSNPPTRVSRMTFGRGIFAACGYGYYVGYQMELGSVMSTTDGITWQQRTVGYGAGGIVYSGGIFLASLNGSGMSVKSTDGTNWQYNGFSTAFNYLSRYYSVPASGCSSAVCAYKGTFLVGGSEGMLIQSGNILNPAVFTSSQLNTNSFSFYYNQQIDVTYHVQTSTNLKSWENIYDGIGSGQTTNFTYPASSSSRSRFFRIVSP